MGSEVAWESNLRLPCNTETNAEGAQDGDSGYRSAKVECTANESRGSLLVVRDRERCLSWLLRWPYPALQPLESSCHRETKGGRIGQSIQLTRRAPHPTNS